MRFLAIIAIVVLSGCSSPSIMHETYKGGRILSRTTLRTAEYPLGDSYIRLEGETITANVSASQDAKTIIGSKADAQSMKIMYGICGLIVLLGVVAFALPNQMVSNKDALIICGIGAGGFMVVRWVSAAAPVMAWVLPAIVVGAVLYLLYLGVLRKKVREQ